MAITLLVALAKRTGKAKVKNDGCSVKQAGPFSHCTLVIPW